MTPLEAELLNSTTVVCVNRTSVVNATETFVHCFEPWTNEGQARFALGVVGTILILLSILTLFGAGGAAKQAPDDAEMAKSRSVDLGAYGEAGKGGDGAFAAVKAFADSVPGSNLLWKSLKWKRTMPDDAPPGSLYAAMRHSAVQRKNSGFYAMA
mmetsp:Transcript_23083/g.68090  ORF Transcript_23083/g.68090 Transcript_23083/m.68090 type:complete len:155 (+) Transcript_23083:60-524(+)